MLQPHEYVDKAYIAKWFGSYSRELHGDPYPFYTFMLAQHPVYYIEERGYWVASSYAEVNRVLKDSAFVREYRNAVPPEQIEEMPAPAPEWQAVNDVLNHWMLFLDAPAHTRLRGLVSHAFTPRTMERMEPTIRMIAEHLAERMAEEPDRELDLIASFAFPLPVIVIAELLGAPAEDRDRFKGWSQAFAKVLEGSDLMGDFAVHARQAAVEITEYFRVLVEERKREPREDLISGMLAAQANADTNAGATRDEGANAGEKTSDGAKVNAYANAGEKASDGAKVNGSDKAGGLTDQELIATCVLLLVAGHETTVNLIGNVVRLLLQHPEQLARLREHPELAASAIEEALRFESPVQSTGRIAARDFELGGKTIRRGQNVNVLLGAANRDPDQFRDPERFDIARQPNRHLAFASGAHFCLGAPLARMEGEIALAVLLARFPNLQLVSDVPDWRLNMLFRGQETLAVRW